VIHRGAYIKAVIAISLVRLLLRFSDSLVARATGFAAFILKWLGASADMLATLEEVKAIFAKGGEGTRIVRRMAHEGDERRLRMIIRGRF